MNPEEEVVELLKNKGVDVFCTLPCDRVKALYSLIKGDFLHVPLTREEEGVGIAAGLAIAGKRPAMLIQSSGMGNMINALASLTLFYELPLFVLFSWRGVYKEAIAAQRPMGGYLPDLLRLLGIEYVEVNKRVDIPKMGESLDQAYMKSRVAAALLSPRVWEESNLRGPEIVSGERALLKSFKRDDIKPRHTRYEIIKGLKSKLKGRVVVSNLGVPSKELYTLMHQPSNFYMLGSMGMATPIGMGIALGSEKEVVVLDGDGSLLMNPGILATTAEMSPENLSILAIDNGVHGSTGNQPTATMHCAHLEMLARAMGIKNTALAITTADVSRALDSGKGPRFIHIIAKPGNASVGEIPLSPQQIKENVMGFLSR